MPTAAERADAAARRAEALRLRLGGFSFVQIGAQLGGVTPQRAYQLYRGGLRALARESTEQARQAEDERLLMLYRAALPQALGGSPRHITAALAALADRRRLLGLDAADEARARLAVAVEHAAPLVVEVLTAVVDQLGLSPERRGEALGLARAELLAIEGGRTSAEQGSGG